MQIQFPHSVGEVVKDYSHSVIFSLNSIRIKSISFEAPIKKTTKTVDIFSKH